MTESIPTRVWTVHVRKDQCGTVTVRESDLDVESGMTFDQIKSLAVVRAQGQATADHGVMWSKTDVTYSNVTWS